MRLSLIFMKTCPPLYRFSHFFPSFFSSLIFGIIASLLLRCIFSLLVIFFFCSSSSFCVMCFGWFQWIESLAQDNNKNVRMCDTGHILCGVREVAVKSRWSLVSFHLSGVISFHCFSPALISHFLQHHVKKCIKHTYKD